MGGVKPNFSVPEHLLEVSFFYRVHPRRYVSGKKFLLLRYFCVFVSVSLYRTHPEQNPILRFITFPVIRRDRTGAGEAEASEREKRSFINSSEYSHKDVFYDGYSRILVAVGSARKEFAPLPLPQPCATRVRR